MQNLYSHKTVQSAINWYNHNKPGKAKVIYILEEDVKSHQEDKTVAWSVMCLLLKRAIKSFSTQKQRAFYLRWLYTGFEANGTRDRRGNDIRYSYDEIAETLSIRSIKTVRKYVREVLEEVERQFINARVIPPLDEHEDRK